MMLLLLLLHHNERTINLSNSIMTFSPHVIPLHEDALPSQHLLVLVTLARKYLCLRKWTLSIMISPLCQIFQIVKHVTGYCLSQCLKKYCILIRVYKENKKVGDILFGLNNRRVVRRHLLVGASHHCGTSEGG